MSNHEQIQEKLVDMALGQLPQTDKDAILRHIEDCPDCKALYENLTKALDVTEQVRTTTVDDQICDNAKSRLFNTIKAGQSPPAEHINFRIWRTIMKNPLIKIAAAAVIIIAVLIGFTVWNQPEAEKTFVEGPQDKQQQINNETQPKVELATTKDDILQKQLHEAKAMFAAADTAGLRKLLKTGEYQAKVAAANYLAQLGDIDAIEPLDTTAQQYTGTSQAEPFIDAAEQLKEIASGQSTGSDEEPTADATAMAAFTISEILNVLPAETLFCLRLNRLDYGLMSMDQFLSGVSPVPMAASMAVHMQLSKMLADPTLTNVDTIGDFAVFGVVKPGSEGKSPDDMVVAFLVPMKDYDKFVTDNTNCSNTDANGVSVINSNGQKTNMLKLGNYGLICQGSSYQTLLDIADVLTVPGRSLAGTLPASVVTKAKEKPLWAYANVQHCEKVFGEFIRAGIKESQEFIAKQQTQSSGYMAPPAEALGMYYGMLDIISEEMEYIAVSCAPTAEVLDLQIDVKAVPQTPMARMFATNPNKKKNQLLPYLNDGSVANIAINLNSPFWEEWSLTGYDIISFMSEKEIPQETIANLQLMINDMIKAAGYSVGDFSVPDGNEPGISITWIAEVRDEQTWLGIQEQLMQMWGQDGFADVYSKNFGIDMSYEIQKNIETYKGVSIDSAFLAFKAKDPNSEYGQMIHGIYGDGFSYRWAIVDGLYVCAIGIDSQEKIYKLIDMAKDPASLELCQEITTAMNMLTDAEKCDFFGTYNYLRTLNFVKAFIPQQAQDVFEQIDLTSEENLVFGGICEDGSLSMQIVMPKDHLLEIKNALEVLGPALNQAQIQQPAQTADVNQN